MVPWDKSLMGVGGLGKRKYRKGKHLIRRWLISKVDAQMLNQDTIMSIAVTL